MVNISISLEEDILAWLDMLIKRGTIKSRSEAVRGGILNYLANKSEIKSLDELHAYIASKQVRPFQDSAQAIKSVREENDLS